MSLSIRPADPSRPGLFGEVEGIVMHRARRYPAQEVRELHRTTVADVAPTLEQAA